MPRNPARITIAEPELRQLSGICDSDITIQVQIDRDLADAIGAPDDGALQALTDRAFEAAAAAWRAVMEEQAAAHGCKLPPEAPSVRRSGRGAAPPPFGDGATVIPVPPQVAAAILRRLMGADGEATAPDGTTLVPGSKDRN
jgi:hypothetical protein